MTSRTLAAKLVSPLPLILLLAFVLRVAGVAYGLPLTVVSDETPFTFAALKMLQLKTLIPVLHPESFQSILPYPPYLSYALLAPFAIILGIQYALFQGNAALFQAELVTDLSDFFIIARLFSVMIGTATVFLVYRIAQTLFRSQIAAYAAAFLLATSILHIALSMVGRNWIAVSFVFAAILYALTRAWSLKRRYLYASVVAGVGMGISSFPILFCFFIGLYYVLFDARSARDVVRDAPAISVAIAVFVVLAALPLALYRNGNVFLGAVTIFGQKTLPGFIASPVSVFALIAPSEPVLVFFAVAGLFMLALRNRALAMLAGGWILFYAAVFYIAFRFEPRFFVPLLPLFAILGGYAISILWNRRLAFVVAVMLFMSLGNAVRVSYLALQGDTRTHAREWALEHLEPQDKILVFSSAMHLPTRKEAVGELRAIEPSVVRAVDEADEIIDRRDTPHALNNLTMLSNKAFIESLPRYAPEKGYTHLLLEPRSLVEFPEMARAFGPIIDGATELARFEGLGDLTSLYNSQFSEPFTRLYERRSFGPDIIIYGLSDNTRSSGRVW